MPWTPFGVVDVSAAAGGGGADTTEVSTLLVFTVNSTALLLDVEVVSSTAGVATTALSSGVDDDVGTEIGLDETDSGSAESARYSIGLTRGRGRRRLINDDWDNDDDV